VLSFLHREKHIINLPQFCGKCKQEGGGPVGWCIKRPSRESKVLKWLAARDKNDQQLQGFKIWGETTGNKESTRTVAGWSPSW
jgi:hypothetical protein